LLVLIAIFISLPLPWRAMEQWLASINNRFKPFLNRMDMETKQEFQRRLDALLTVLSGMLR